MKKTVYISIASIVFTLVLALALNTKAEIVSKPMDFCVAPYEWAACEDWSFKALRLIWGAEKDENFIAIINNENWHMIWNGTAYDRSVIKTYMIQSSLLGDTQLGDCGGWGGICYKYSEYIDSVNP